MGGTFGEIVQDLSSSNILIFFPRDPGKTQFMCSSDEKWFQILDCTGSVIPVAAPVALVVVVPAAAARVRDVFFLIRASMSLKALLVIIMSLSRTRKFYLQSRA